MIDDLHRAKRGTALLVACMAQTISETDPSFADRLVKRLEAAYSEVRDDDTDLGDGVGEMELLSWVRELLTGFSPSTGKGKPFLSDYNP